MRPIGRRDFLKAAAAAMAVPAIVPARVFGADAPSKTLALACIGVGRMGCSDLREALRVGGTGVRIVAVCDTDRNRARSAAQEISAHYGAERQAAVYQDYRELLARGDFDGVIIATPDFQHAVVAVAAAKAGKDIYLEKPLTYSIADGQRLVEAVRKNKVVLQTGSQQRSSQYFRITCVLVCNSQSRHRDRGLDFCLLQQSGRCDDSHRCDENRTHGVQKLYQSDQRDDS